MKATEAQIESVVKAGFTPELKTKLKRMGHIIYDEMYHKLYVADCPPEDYDVRDASSTFEWRSLRRVTEPLILGYRFAQPDADTRPLQDALREIGYQLSQKLGWDERDDYDEVQALFYAAFDQIFVQAEGQKA